MGLLMIAAYSEADAHTRRIIYDELTAARSVLSFYRERADTAAHHHHDDIAHIGRRLLEEAAARQWCSDYDRFTDEVNADLNVRLPLRDRDFDVVARIDLHMRVTATSEDLARDQAESVVDEVGRLLAGHPSVTAYPTPAYRYRVDPVDD